MRTRVFEKRKFPRVDTSKQPGCEIKVFGVKGKLLEGKVINISLGGVAFVSSYKNITQTLKKYSTRVKIQLPEVDAIEANTTLLRIRPEITSDDCLFVMKWTEMNGSSTARLKKFISI